MVLRIGGKYFSKLYASSLSNFLAPQSAAIYTSSFGKLGKFNPSQFIPKNVLEPYYGASQQPNLGRMADKKPFKMELKKGETYVWCCCGWSKTQPFCDGTHKNPYMKLSLKPVYFQVEKDGTYWLCNCKQTKHRPFCDGSHRADEVQEKLKYL